MSRSQNYIETQVIEALNFCKSSPSDLLSLSLICQTIEVYGAFLDSKPFACKGQSQKRFDLALKQLFPESYHSKNKGSAFYFKLRCSVLHYFQLHQLYALSSKPDLHLNWSEKQINLNIATFLEDCILAGKKLINLLEDNALKSKKSSSVLFNSVLST
ncbi:MAG: hypothetical protein ACPGEC_05500 [Flavobacteriales bacterium]